jgi:hypothetical protein
MTSVIERFKSIVWHDSSLGNLTLLRTPEEERVRIPLGLLQKGYSLKFIDLIFHETVYVKMDVYAAAKRVCSDHISYADCSVDSEWIRAVKAKHPYDDFDDLFHFHFHLCRPGGSIDILAEDFSFEPALDNSWTGYGARGPARPLTPEERAQFCKS